MPDQFELTPERSEQISQIIAEFSEVFAFVRTRWARFAEETHPTLHGSGILVLQIVLRKGPVTVTGLSQLLGMDKGMVSRQVSKLRELGFVDSAPAAEDRRVTLITATDQARAVIDRLRARAAHDYHMRFADWEDADLNALSESLHRFNSSVPEQADGPAVRCARGLGGGAESAS